jgi:protoporphyrinogen oxidase
MGMEYFVTEGDELWEENDEKFISNAIDELVKLKIVDRADVIDAVRIKVKKAYPAYFDSYKNIDQVINYLNKFSNLYCIGRNGQHRYNNMDHSMLTAIEAVKVFIDPNNNSKDIIWKVNTEQEYHESKDSKQ